MASTLNLIYNVDSPDQSELLEAFLQTTKAIIPEFVRGDHTIAILVRPVVASDTGQRPWDDDYISGDTFLVAIGNPDEAPTGGTWEIEVAGQTSGLTALAYNISTTALATAVNAAITAGGGGQPLCSVANPSDGVYVLTGLTNGGGPIIDGTGGGGNLTPASNDPLVSVVRTGSASTTWMQTIVLRQQPVALSNPLTAQPAAGVTRTYTQSATTGQNNIVRISFDADGTYGGLFTINATAGGVTAACGQVGPLATADELALVMAQHPHIHFQTPSEDNNIIVTKDGTAFIVEFTDDLSGPSQTQTITTSSVANPSVITVGSTAGWATGQTVTIAGHSGSTPSINGNHVITVLSGTTFSIPVNVTVGGTGGTAFNTNNGTLTVSNLNLLAPVGLSGTLNLNTYNLANAFWDSQTDELSFTLEIQRTRASGEVRTGLSVPVTIKADVIDVASLVPVIIPSGLTVNSGVMWLQGITEYIDGSIGLASVATTGLENVVALINHNTDGARMFNLKTDSTATLAGFVIQPDDDASKRWLSMM